jgi:hypothetical protein
MTLIAVSLTASGAFAETAQGTAPDSTLTVNQRENQKDRIQAGNKSDQLTKAEATKLRTDDAAIRAQQEGVPSGPIFARQLRHAQKVRRYPTREYQQSQPSRKHRAAGTIDKRRLRNGRRITHDGEDGKALLT